MVGPRWLHLQGFDAWRSCDHDNTVLDLQGGVRLELQEFVDPELKPGDEEIDPRTDLWLLKKRGVVSFSCGPEDCQSGALMADAKGHWLHDRGLGWIDREPREARKPLVSPTRFAPQPTSSQDETIHAMHWGPVERLWTLVSRTQGVTLVVRDRESLRVLARLPAPSVFDFAIFSGGIVAIDESGVWHRSWSGRWQRLELVWADGMPHSAGLPDLLPTSLIPLAVAGRGARVVVIFAGPKGVRRSFIGEITARGFEIQALPDELVTPRHVAVGHEGEVFVADMPSEVGGRVEVASLRGEAGSWITESRWTGAHFDGRALWVNHDGRPQYTAAKGAKSLRRRRDRYTGAGRVESFGLDSQRMGCVWHRLRVDVCLPANTTVRAYARTSDALWPEGQQRVPRAPESIEGLAPPVALGSRDIDDNEGWVAVRLQKKTRYADRSRLPLGRDDGPDELTLEGLLATPPGRYLWVRLEIQGSRHATPVLKAIRPSYPRPSMLDLLPAFWRSGPESDRNERFLALFEGVLTQIDERIETLPVLFDPTATDASVLSWLSSFVGLSLDQSLPETAKRKLLERATALFRARGTVSAIEEMVEIVSGSPSIVVEQFRLRRRRGAVLGQGPGESGPAIMGLSLELSPEAPSESLKTPMQEFFGRAAHRFQVLIGRPQDPTLQALVDRVIEMNKPAHTIHSICWLDRGIELDRNAFVGLVHVGMGREFEGARLGHFQLHSNAILGSARALRFGTHPGRSKLGHSSLLV